MKTSRRLASVLAMLLVVTGCGLKGPLYLPAEPAPDEADTVDGEDEPEGAGATENGSDG